MTTDPLSPNAHCYFLLNELSTELFNSFSKIATCIIFLLELFYTLVCPRVEASSLLFLQHHSRPPPPSFGLHLLHTAAASSPAPLIILFSPSIFFLVFTRLIAFTFVELTPGALLGGFASFFSRWFSRVSHSQMDWLSPLCFCSHAHSTMMPNDLNHRSSTMLDLHLLSLC